MINMKLAKERGLSKSDVKDLEALHYCVNCLVADWDFAVMAGGGDLQRKTTRKTLRRIEYQMQRLWGFKERKRMHTHRAQFAGLYSTPAVSTKHVRLSGSDW